VNNAAFLNSQTTCAMIEAMGMQATNEQKKLMGEYPCYTESDFQSLISKYQIGYNDALIILQRNNGY